MKVKQRLDRLLVQRGLAESREKAQALIIAGEVSVDGVKASKAGQSVLEDSSISIAARPAHVSRGGLKLEAALKHWEIPVQDRTCLDVGSSTGGFTDCLLQHGAKKVYAVDVGTNQLDWRLRNDPRVVVKERLNARTLESADIGEPVDLIVCDVSFISVTLLLSAIVPLLQSDGEMVILVKPQFEVGKGQVGKGGIVKDPALHQAACTRIEQAVRQFSFETSLMESPILGAEGNKEFLLRAKRPG
jgi:23S rRNA (cytidine1920-2'-O)/16S rRNA (cytidine1409-2'-O)-methyltransferase